MPKMTYETAMEAMKQYTCFFCNKQADRIGYYGKLYHTGLVSRENPTFFCLTCWNNPLNRESINGNRGGMEGVFCMTFEDLGKMTDQKIGYWLGKKNYEINHCANARWRKIIRHIHYLNKPPKERRHAA